MKTFVEALGDGVSEKMHRPFVRKSGVMVGAESEMYYRAYCFFEKKRIWEGKAKSTARKNAEAEYVAYLLLSLFLLCPPFLCTMFVCHYGYEMSFTAQTRN